ncbi:hypothetical protein HS088_TW22G00705 [Tripterygium wilfordii]|uniref:LysM domain-containing protein n=1 Tax=Tripterygium wilfordii TaxID=458696 RepID=A0A7J7BYP7_TRIWF|nr:hypothetical protein HS088_TW22G00705 [Tripterygium wilfordii]
MATRAINYLLFLMLCFLLISSVAESFKLAGVNGAPRCKAVGMVEIGDTCIDIANTLGLAQDKFMALNPDLDCKKLSIGQWLCIGMKKNK